MTLGFIAQVEAFGEKAMMRAEDIFKQSAQEVFIIAQIPVALGGNMPVDTGFLRNSLTVGLSGSTALTGPDAYIVIAGADLDSVIIGGWTANYARHQEYGSQGRAGRFFALNAVQQWQAIVSENAAAAASLG